MGFGVWGLGFGVWGLEFRVEGFGVVVGSAALAGSFPPSPAPPAKNAPANPPGRVFMIDTRAQRKLLHTWIMLAIVKQQLAQIG